MHSLNELTPHVGVARPYTYDGGAGERKRKGNCYAFHLFAGGKTGGFMTVEDRRIPLDKGMLVFVRPGQWHSFVISPAQTAPSHNLYCDLWQTGGFRSDIPQFTYDPQPYRPEQETTVKRCLELDRLPTAVSIAAYPHLSDNFAYLSRTANEPRIHRQATLDSLMYAWLLELHHLLFGPRPTDPRIIGLLREIETHPERHPSHEQLSEACGMKKSYFYELFKKETGLAVHEYIVKSRLAKAAAALQESDRSVTAIAAELGYASINHFSRQFAARYGVSPSRYRSLPPPDASGQTEAVPVQRPHKNDHKERPTRQDGLT